MIRQLLCLGFGLLAIPTFAWSAPRDIPIGREEICELNRALGIDMSGSVNRNGRIVSPAGIVCDRHGPFGPEHFYIATCHDSAGRYVGEVWFTVWLNDSCWLGR